MSMPLLKYAYSSQNQRVEGFEVVGNEELPRIFSTDTLPTASEMDQLIWAAYRQIFSEHQILKFNRDTYLESQLRFNQITVREFIQGLLLSDAFRTFNYDVNNNYRFVEMCVQRVLGRDVYNEKEKIAWSIVLCTKGLEAFVKALINSEEYLRNFGDNTVPYQRRRILGQRSKGEVPFNLKTPRYGADFKERLGMPQFAWQGAIRSFRPQELKPKAGDPINYLEMSREVLFSRYR
jgi:phycobilisome rod-core linker protein|uniref:Phycobilisome rod-core linker polypeptide n=2 Tax=Cyanidioschyzon merolae TaxID=45157 RepID=Q85G55_CYAM1|nr:phycobilisome rod-core linker protein [Cyanidioschyzon merolae strain 10D]API65564.1 phycobilisome rod-core linker polypeptide [Transformation vector pCCATCH]QFV16947.1 phycobilisome rod-core linker polypeptide [Cyanidioschyzon merolae]QFV17126.1 phycobilisome rod-core linker polypeptide [Cyanidioschyzon merolae]BAC76136.1 phycobilisome rod-core linker polypeptide [Cyanidioschyzon merolae strain 10D]